MIDQDIILEAKLANRVNTTELDAWLLRRLNHIYKTYARKMDWPQLLVPAQTLSITTFQDYALPADFDRFLDDTILWDVDAVGNVRGGAMEVVDQVQIAWYASTATAARPLAAYVKWTAGAPFLSFLPQFTSSLSIAVLYSYYRLPTAFTGLGVVTEIPKLDETLVAALSKDLCAYHGLGKDGSARTQYFAQEERANYRAAIAGLYTNPRP